MIEGLITAATELSCIRTGATRGGLESQATLALTGWLADPGGDLPPENTVMPRLASLAAHAQRRRPSPPADPRFPAQCCLAGLPAPPLRALPVCQTPTTAPVLSPQSCQTRCLPAFSSTHTVRGSGTLSLFPHPRPPSRLCPRASPIHTTHTTRTRRRPRRHRCRCHLRGCQTLYAATDPGRSRAARRRRLTTATRGARPRACCCEPSLLLPSANRAVRLTQPSTAARVASDSSQTDNGSLLHRHCSRPRPRINRRAPLARPAETYDAHPAPQSINLLIFVTVAHHVGVGPAWSAWCS